MTSTCYDYPSAPHGTPAFYVPDVVVHPPVEEQTSVCMPYMVFDAATAVPNPGPCTPELSAVASRLETWQHDIDAYTDASSTPRWAYSSRRASIHRSTPLGFISSDLYRCQASSPELSPTGTVDSLDVVEVVKVPRTRNGNAYGEQTADKQPKRGGLGARLRSSLRVVSSGSRKSPYEKPSAVEYARPTQPKENTPPLPPRKLVMPPPVESERSKAGKASLQRSRSTRLGLSQLFTFGSAQSVPDAATTGAAAPPPGRHSMSASSTLTVSSGSTKVSDAQTLRPSLDETSVPGSTSKSIRRGFSFGNLQALFVPPAASPSGPLMPALSSPTRTSSSLPQDQEQESAPQTPDMNDFSLPSIPPFIAAAGEQDGGMTARKGGEIDGADAVMDDSFEMHLDSLHFESLSFDADRFDLSP